MNLNVNAAFALLGRFKNRGITHCVISPGSRSTPLAYVAHQLFEISVVIDERDAGFLALGIAQATGVAPIVITTSGSAPSHLFPAVSEAYNSNVGLVIISADRPHELRSVGAPQTINQVDLFGSHVRYSFDTKLASEVNDVEYWNDIADNIYGIVSETSLCRGPAHLNIGFDENLSPDGDEIPYEKIWLAPISYPEHKEESLKLKKLINGSMTGVITVGRNHHVHLENIFLLSEMLDWPIFADVTSSLRSYDGVFTNYDAMLRTESFDKINFECVLQLGDPLGSKLWNQKIANKNVIAIKKYDDKRDPYLNYSDIVHISNLNSWIENIIADAYTKELSHRSTFNYDNESMLDDYNKLSEQCAIELSNAFNLYPISEPALFNKVGELLSSFGANIFIGNSMPIRYAEWFWPVLNENSNVYCNRGTNGIDGSLACTSGIAISSNKQTVSIVGDVSFAHDIGFLGHANVIAREANINIIFVVIDNGGGAIFTHLEQGKNVAMKESYSDIMQTPTNIDFKKIALAFNCRTGDSLKDLSSALASNEPGVDVIVLKTDHLSGREFMSELNSNCSKL